MLAFRVVKTVNRGVPNHPESTGRWWTDPFAPYQAGSIGAPTEVPRRSRTMRVDSKVSF